MFDRIVGLVNGFKRYFLDHGQPVSENPSPGNIEGGITTLEEKSLGAVQKAGRAPVADVLGYGERVRRAGLSLLEAPGNDAVSSTALAAAGATIILFTTGRGTPLGFPAPTIKIATNSALAAAKPGWIDFDAGRGARRRVRRRGRRADGPHRRHRLGRDDRRRAQRRARHRDLEAGRDACEGERDRDRPFRPGRVPSRASGGLCRPAARRRSALGDRGGVAALGRDGRGAAAAAGALHARHPRRAAQSYRTLAAHREALRSGRRGGGAAAARRSGGADRHLDGDREGLLPRRRRDARFRPSGHRSRPRIAGAAARA